MPSVQCYSIDPALSEHTAAVGDTAVRATVSDIDFIAQSEEFDRYESWNEVAPQVCVKAHAMTHPWSTVDRLHLMPFKIENVRLRCARAVVVLLHAHVSLEDVRRAVPNTMAVICVPCCNYGPRQSEICNRLPDHVYEDPHMLSDKNEVRVWWLGSPTTAIGWGNQCTNQDAAKIWTKAMLNTRSRRARDQMRARLVASSSASRGITECVAMKSFRQAHLVSSESSVGCLALIADEAVALNIFQNEATCEGVIKRVDLDVVMKIGQEVRSRCGCGNAFITSGTDGSTIAPVLRITVSVKGKKYESSYLLILSVGSSEGDASDFDAQSDLQIILSKKYFSNQTGLHVIDTVNMAFDNLRDSIRNGDIIEVTGCPGRTSHGDPALFVWDVYLISMTLPFDVIHTASCVRAAI